MFSCSRMFPISVFRVRSPTYCCERQYKTEDVPVKIGIKPKKRNVSGKNEKGIFYVLFFGLFLSVEKRNLKK